MGKEKTPDNSNDGERGSGTYVEEEKIERDSKALFFSISAQINGAMDRWWLRQITVHHPLGWEVGKRRNGVEKRESQPQQREVRIIEPRYSSLSLRTGRPEFMMKKQHEKGTAVTLVEALSPSKTRPFLSSPPAFFFPSFRAQDVG